MASSQPPQPRIIKPDSLLDELRQRIVTGELAPGARLPTRRQLQTSHQFSSITVQHALDSLIADGFVVPRGRNGTFVAERPPHLHRFGLVMAGGSEENNFWRALAAAMQTLVRDSIDLRLCMHIDGRNGAEERLFVEDMQAHRLSGVLLTSVYLGDAEPLVRFPSLPRVSIMGAPSLHPRISGLILDSDSFIRTALDHLAARGCKRLAIIGVNGQESDWLQRVGEGAKQRGLELRPHWTHFLPQSLQHDSARSLTHLLFHADQTCHPDSLLIGDDQLVEGASIGLAAARAGMTGEVVMVGHCNYPLPPRSHVPITYVGYDASELITVAVAMLRELRQTGQPRIPDRRILARLAPGMAAIQ